ncbi:GDSL esterase/lipase At4g26790-like [Magnolia sinica]|uniref:GDSL esterase/lipase At4g26790-like n=1 Tax=Magnolia sinica TaxID=86752 RepID=UPI002658559A|nr:GDSL esterase/lipase At4g26790-like [Magnolia sinica]
MLQCKMAHSSHMMAHMIIPWLLLLQLLILAVEIDGSVNIPSIIIFGDSSVDTGNNNYISTIARSNFEPYGRDFKGGRPTGRFCNGRVATDFISEALGLKPAVPAYLDPTYSIKDLVTGVCFASAGTGYDNATSDVLNVIPLWKQLEYFKAYQMKLRTYLGEKSANRILTEAMYMISLGTNDFLENYYVLNRRSQQFTIDAFEDFLVGIADKFVRDLYNLGARKISIGGIPPMGCMPLERTNNVMAGSTCVEKYNTVARDFNGKMRALAFKLRNELVGIRTVHSDVYDTMLLAIEKPSMFGFENVAVGCCATGMFEMGYLCDRMNPFTCQDASKYVFWDSFHPTEKMNQIIADHVMNTSLAAFV